MDLLSRLFIFYFWKTLGPSASSKMIADLFSVPKTSFLTIQKTKDIKFLISGKFEVTILLRMTKSLFNDCQVNLFKTGQNWLEAKLRI